MLHKVFQLLIDTLISDATTKGYVANRIYPSRIAEIRNPTFPLITLRVVSPMGAGSRAAEISKCVMELRTHAITQKSACEIYSAAKAKLNCKRIYNVNYYLVTGELPDMPKDITDPDSEPIVCNAYGNFGMFITRRT